MTLREVKNNAHENVLSPFQSSVCEVTFYMCSTMLLIPIKFHQSLVFLLSFYLLQVNCWFSAILGYMYEAECCDMRKGHEAGAPLQNHLQIG